MLNYSISFIVNSHVYEHINFKIVEMLLSVKILKLSCLTYVKCVH